MKSPNPRDYIYDIETYPNCFTFAAKHEFTGERYLFEFSYRKNQLADLMGFLQSLHLNKSRMVGYNNLHFDYPVIHFILQYFWCGAVDTLTPYMIYEKATSIIFSNNPFEHMIWDNERYVEQLDLLKIHHFDNNAKRTSLKMLEFNMRVHNIEDLPFPPGTFLEPDQIDTLIKYNVYGDVDNTGLFYFKSLEHIEFREELCEKYGSRFLNYSNTKIGSEYLRLKLEESNPKSCYEYVNNERVTRQTPRPSINLDEVIFPYVQFTHPEFKRVRNWLAAQTITETKGVFKDLHCTIDGFTYVFGTGGIHGSIESQIVSSDNEHVIIDLDVASYYPNIGIKNRVYPEHLGVQFCDDYEDIYFERKKYKKGTPLNKALKESLNASYGNSNQIYSFLYDPKYTMTITINGQLMLCMLAEYLRNIPGLQMIQINTDGLTVKVRRDQAESVNQIAKFWEQLTGLELEEARYSRMFIRDVNSYIAEYEDGKLKHKGAYVYEDLEWHKDHSSLVIQKAAEAALVYGKDIREFIANHSDIMDFMLRTKVPRSSELKIKYGPVVKKLQNIARYYVSTDGGELFKVMPPIWKDFYIYDSYNCPDTVKVESILKEKERYYKTRPGVFLVSTKADCKFLEKHGCRDTGNKTREQGPERKIGINTSWKVTPCNNMDDATPHTIDYEFYIHEAEKLVNPLRGN